MKDFKETLYEALLFSFGKILAKYNTYAQDSILKDVGKEIIEYINANGFEFKETGSLDDLSTLIDLFVENGFVESLEIKPADKGHNYVWKNLYGLDAYKELQNISENPFLACPLNACLYYIAGRHHKTLKLHRKEFDIKNRMVESQEEIIDQESPKGQGFDSLVIENSRLYEIAEERAKELQQALDEIKVLRGFLPICSQCKSIRDDKGYWNRIESYIHEHSEAEFTHSICPECTRALYPELEI